MVQSRTQVYFLPADGSVTRAFRSGVSLHSHTEHSQERLGDLPRYLERMPVVAQFLQWERKRYHAKTGRAVDFRAPTGEGRFVLARAKGVAIAFPRGSRRWRACKTRLHGLHVRQRRRA